MTRQRRLKKIRLHSEGTQILQRGLLGLVVLNLILFYALRGITLVPFWIVLAVSVALYLVAVNFFRCPIRQFNGT